jgi:hypothetical protein
MDNKYKNAIISLISSLKFLSNIAKNTPTSISGRGSMMNIEGMNN